MKNLLFAILLLLLPFHSKAGDTFHAPASEFQQEDLKFKANHGRYSPEILFYAHDQQMVLGFRQDGVEHWFPGKSGKYESCITLLFEGMNPESKPVSSNPFQDPTYFLIGNTKPETEYAFHDLTWKNIYPLIDLVFHTSEDGMKFDFVLHPGADASQIRMVYEGATSVDLTASGEIKITTKDGCLTEAAPVSFTRAGSSIESAYSVTGNTVQFHLGNYPADEEVVIDPPRRWSLVYGGNGFDFIQDIAADTNGNSFVAGFTNSTNFPFTIQSGVGGAYDCFVAKFDSNGTRQWTLIFGGTGNDFAYGLCLDNSGNIIVTGETDVMGFPFTITTYPGTLSELFVMKLSSTGGLIWSMQYGSSGADKGNDVRTDAANNIYLAGVAGASDISTTANTYNGIAPDAFVLKLDPNGLRSWAQRYGGLSFDYFNDLSVSGTGDVFLAGETGSSNFPVTTSGFAGSGTTKATLVKFDNAGTRQWAFKYGGSNADRANGITLNPAGNLLVAGVTNSPDFPVTLTASQGTGQDAFLLSFTQAGGRQWAQKVGGSSTDLGNAVACDADGNIFVTGETNSTDFPATLANFAGASTNAFMAKFDNSGTRIWSWLFGGGLQDFGVAVETGRSPQVYFGGHTQGSAFPSTINTYAGAGTEGYLVNITDCKNLVAAFTFAEACQVDSVVFTNTSNAGTSVIIRSHWDFGDGDTSNAVSPFHHYLNEGNYTVTLTITNACGISQSVVHVVRVFPMPLANFTYVDICEGDTVHFTSTSSVISLFGSVIQNHNWLFNGTSSQTGLQASYLQAVYDTFPAQLICETNLGCRDTLVQNVVVFPYPRAGFTIQNACDPDSAVLTDTSTIPLGSLSGRNWIYNNTGISSSPVITWGPPGNGNFGFTLEVTSDQGCLTRVTDTVVIYPKPEAAFEFSEVCFPDTLWFTDYSSVLDSSLATWNWNFGDGVADSTQNPAHHYAAADSFDVTLMVETAFGCRDTVMQLNVVHPKPIAGFFADTVCLGFPTTHTDSSTAGFETVNDWDWDFGDSTFSDGQIVTHTYSGSGDWNPSLTVTTDFGCSDVVSLPIHVWVLPVPVIAAEGLPDLCFGDTLTLQVDSIFTAFTWSTQETESSIVVDTTGIYFVEVTDTNTCIASDSFQVIYHAAPGPMPDFNLGASTMVCGGDTFMLDAGPGYYSYLWNTGDTMRIVPVVQAGDFQVSVTNGFGCLGISDSLQVGFLPVPAVPVIQNNSGVLSVSTGVAWQWWDGSMMVPGADTSFFIPTQTGNYLVAVTDENGCTVFSDVVEITVNLDGTIFRNFNLYPNPTSGEIYFESSLEGAAYDAELLDISGRKMAQFSGHFSNGKARFNLGEYPNGIYMLHLISAEGQISKRIVVSR